MNESHNVLVIEEMRIECNLQNFAYKLKAELLASIKFHNPFNGLVFMNRQYSSIGIAYSQDDAMKIAIENFLNGNFNSESSDMMDNEGCTVSNNIHHIDCMFQEPMKSEFLKLFNPDNWQIPAKELTSSTSQ